jgi:hypothetical protein
MKTFIVNKTVPIWVTVSYEVIARNEKEAYDEFIKGDYNHNPVGAVELGATLNNVDPKIVVKEKDQSS